MAASLTAAVLESATQGLFSGWRLCHIDAVARRQPLGLAAGRENVKNADGLGRRAGSRSGRSFREDTGIASLTVGHDRRRRFQERPSTWEASGWQLFQRLNFSCSFPYWATGQAGPGPELFGEWRNDGPDGGGRNAPAKSILDLDRLPVHGNRPGWASRGRKPEAAGRCEWDSCPHGVINGVATRCCFAKPGSAGANTPHADMQPIRHRGVEQGRSRFTCRFLLGAVLAAAVIEWARALGIWMRGVKFLCTSVEVHEPSCASAEVQALAYDDRSSSDRKPVRCETCSDHPRNLLVLW